VLLKLSGLSVRWKLAAATLQSYGKYPAKNVTSKEL
jgi:hypothetical protein